MVKIMINSIFEMPYDFKLFSAGEVHVKIQQKVQYHSPSHIDLRVKLTSPEEVIKLLMVTDACRYQWPNTPIHLIMPYLPFARQDRLCDKGEAFSLKVFAKLINDQNYASVKVYDCHSLVGLALLDRVEHVEQHQIIPEDVLDKYDCIVAPDLGAVKKAEKVAEKAGKPLVIATKQRDPKTGRLSQPKIVDGDPSDLTCLIVDDIADGMGTFKQLASELQFHNCGKIGLYVTHGIFSKGYFVCHPEISEIITTTSFGEYRQVPEFLKVLNVFN